MLFNKESIIIGISSILVPIIGSYLFNLYLNNKINIKLKEIEIKSDKEKLIIDNEQETSSSSSLSSIREILKGKLNEFKIEYNENEWLKLKLKLNETRYFKQGEKEEGNNFEYGFNIKYAKELVNYWLNDYNWKYIIDNKLNKYKHYKLDINNDINLHFIRINTNNNYKQVIPILLINGWPGTFYEFNKLIDYLIEWSLNNNDNISFDIIVPSIPGFDYSSSSTNNKKQIDMIECARLFDALMRYLYSNNESIKYYIHGQDWGSLVADVMSQMYPKRVKGIHITFPKPPLVLFNFYQPNPGLTVPTMLTAFAAQFFPSLMITKEEKKAGLNFDLINRIDNVIREMSHLHIHLTRPDSHGMALSDSPIGLLTHILEKYALWNFKYDTHGLKTYDGGLNYFTKEDLITIATIRWMTNTITSSMRLFKETFFTREEWKREIITGKTPSCVPVGILQLPDDHDHSPLCVLKQMFGNITQYTIAPKGGHFAALHVPEIVGSDLIKFVLLN